MDLKTVIDTARRARNEAARIMDLFGTGGQGIEQTRTAIGRAMMAADIGRGTAERLTEQYVQAARRTQDLNEALYGTAGQLADAAGEINLVLNHRNAPTIF